MKLLPWMDRRMFRGTVIVAVIATAALFDYGVPLADSTQPEQKQKVRLRENSYYYSAFNKRDPFESLIVGEFISDKKMELVDIGRVELVGIVKGDLERLALLEDDRGFSYILRVGDRVRNGSVVAIGNKTMVARVTNYGQTKKHTLRVAKRQEGVRK
ncbi:MAG: hypothetical protein JSW50_16760 [Candidatus Latescibacterota bacterium]|nr:MAG: hypothetical protein JSW50_16760 [Candidatus Latescibacterota bacterium]